METEKLENLIHFIITECKKQKKLAKLGKVKLNKILWFIDTISFKLYRKNVSGTDKYQKKHLGPVNPNLEKVCNILAKHEKIMIEEKTEYINKRIHYTPIVDYDDTCKFFNEAETKLIEWVTNHINDGYNANEISELSHEGIWKHVNMYSDIPLYACLSEREAEPDSEEIKWFEEQVKNNSDNWKKIVNE